MALLEAQEQQREAELVALLPAHRLSIVGSCVVAGRAGVTAKGQDCGGAPDGASRFLVLAATALRKAQERLRKAALLTT